MKSELSLLFPALVASFAPSEFPRVQPRRSFTRLFLNPTEDPNADPTQQSASGVLVSQVQSGLDELYPPTALEKRTAASRTDGYWAYISRGEDPPQETTYGEYDLPFFTLLVDKAIGHYGGGDLKDSVFCDIGSGTGRLVVAAASLYPSFQQCKGVELLNSIHVVARETLGKCDTIGPNLYLPSEPEPLEMAPIDLTCGSFEDVYFGDADLIFCFSSCMSGAIPGISKAVGKQCKPGTIVITTEYQLESEGMTDPGEDGSEAKPFKFELLESHDGYCWLTGGLSTGHIHRLAGVGGTTAGHSNEQQKTDLGSAKPQLANDYWPVHGTR